MRALVLLLAVACGSDDPCAGLRDLVESPDGLALTREEHGVGWGRSDCLLCHPAGSFHGADCASGEIGAIEVDTGATWTCADCHGANGVGG